MSNMKKHSKENRKTISTIETHRTCTIPVRKSTTNPCTVIRHPITANDLGDELTNLIYSEAANKENTGNYDEPILNTILALGRQMQSLQLDRQPMRTLSSIDELSPRSKAVVIPKISKKLNFPHDKTIFRNLIPINVNDSILLPKKKSSIRKKYIVNHKVPTPDLGDFLDPIAPLEHIIPEPDIDLIHDPNDINSFEEFYEFYRDVNPRWIRDEYQL
ncbi:uncharacterized protein LOC129905108 [Episyrphus balteatus]|uniref:uncharacterized protein LOC129905108 n=1 Tax=Episyrphus balteatus TaxID=286459 RepID=UPI002485968E|nr:uncharacterized protein LOC129905108 [Episyrphus balteatus]